MRRTKTAITTICLLAACFSSGGQARAEGQPGVTVSQVDEQISARVVSTPLARLVKELGAVTGTEVVWLTEPGMESISIELCGVPLVQAIERILSHRSHGLANARAQDGSLRHRLWIGSPIEGRRPPASVTQVISARQPKPSDRTQELVNRALNEEQEELRLEAVEQLSNQPASPEIRDALEEILSGDDDPEDPTSPTG